MKGFRFETSRMLRKRLKPALMCSAALAMGAAVWSFAPGTTAGETEPIAGEPGATEAKTKERREVSRWAAEIPDSVPGYLLVDGRWVLDEPVREGLTRATGLQLPFGEMAGVEENPMTPEKVGLGRLLFFDPVLSGSNRESCSTCHHPDHGMADGRAVSMGAGGEGVGPARRGGAALERNAPSLWNAAFQQTQFWDGRAETLEEQAIVPLTNPEEMAADPKELVRELRAIPAYVELFGAAFGGGVETVTLENTARALASFERTLVSINSKFDRYARGDFEVYDASEKRGLMLFRSLHTRCFECHNFPNFSDETFRVLGVPEDAAGVGEMDRGRGGVAETGPEFGFKVPTLRNVALSAPYMHNGRFGTLREVIDFYSDAGGRKEAVAVPAIDEKIHTIDLTEQESEDLVAFLESLTDVSMQPPAPAEVPSGLPVVEVSEAMSGGGAVWREALGLEGDAGEPAPAIAGGKADR